MPDRLGEVRFVLLSGCSGGGKSTLLDALAGRGYATVAEPGRRIVADELATGGTALPWLDPAAFARRAMALALEDRAAAAALDDPVFFDRGLIDAAAFLERTIGEPTLAPLRAEHRYHRCVFLAPPWQDLFASDVERRHDFNEAEIEYRQLATVYPALGYQTIELPKADVAVRVTFVLERLAEDDALRGVRQG